MNGYLYTQVGSSAIDMRQKVEDVYEWMNGKTQCGYTHPVECYSALKRRVFFFVFVFVFFVCCYIHTYVFIEV